MVHPSIFYRSSLQKSNLLDLFDGVKFAIFNLGDRAYGPNFCAAGRKLTVRLMQLGAQLVGEPGYGDDGTPNGGVFADLDLWLENVLLQMLGGSKRNVSEVASDSLQSPYSVCVVEPRPNESLSGVEEWQQERYRQSYQQFFEKLCSVNAYRYAGASMIRNADVGTSPPLVGRVSMNRRITSEDWEQDTRHIVIEVPTAASSAPASWDLHSLPYQAGDVASVLPANSAEEVERFLKVLPKRIQDAADCVLRLDFDDSVEATAGVGFPFWPAQCTLRGWLTYCADIHALPEREDLRALHNFCSVKHPRGLDQRQKLKSLSETSESALYADYILREKRCWAEVLYDFDSIGGDRSMLTIEFLVSLLSPMRPRDFSIASSPSEDRFGLRTGPQNTSFHVDLCVAVVAGTTPLGRSYHGLCSHYLSKLSVENLTAGGPLVRLWIRPGSFRKLPLSIHVTDGVHRMAEPVLCIGAGTGIAPLRGLVREREALWTLSSTDLSSPNSNDELDRDNLLVFGCRKESADFYYRNEWQAIINKGHLGVLTAFSRDQWHKIYVQQVLEKTEKEHELISRHLLERNGAIYIAGGPKMARAVKEVIVESIAKQLKGDKKALSFLSALQRRGKFCVEAWG